MKTQILQLDQNDDSLSVREKMSWSQTGRILLVWPVNGSPLNKRLDLTLLNCHALSIGAQLAVVTRDLKVRYFARQLGIPIFRKLNTALARSWEISTFRKTFHSQHPHQLNFENNRNHYGPTSRPRRENPIISVLCLGISVIAVLLLGGYILPGAKIIISPRVEIQTMNFDLTVNPDETSVNSSTGSLPTSNLEVIVEGHDTITATGTMVFADKPAFGNLKFTNNSKLPINLPAGTIVQHRAKIRVRFIIFSTSDIPIDSNQSEVIDARAVKPGASGNMQANKLVIIEGNHGLDLTVTNPSATQGGSDTTVPTPTIEDNQILRARLIEQLKQSALAELQSILSDDDTLITPTLMMVENSRRSFHPFPW